MLNITQLSQETGIGIDTLRIWERRYNFPQPQRDRRGRRQYPPEQVEQLRVAKHLQLDGYRPGDIFKLDPKQRMDLLVKGCDQQQSDQHGDRQEYFKKISLEWLLNATDKETSAWLQRQLDTLGLHNFIRQCVIPLIWFVDISWKTGAIGIVREHLISDQLSIVLHQYVHQQLQQNALGDSDIKCLCLTLNHERHKLGLLMAASIIAASAIHCTWLQEDIPLTEVSAALEVTGSNTVVLSFSTHYATRDAMEQLATLRRILPQNMHIIAGGGALNGQKNIPGVHISTDLMQLPSILAALTRQRIQKLPPPL
ncbi:MAG: MerR family transcriptional regulator [Desulfuromonadaceae bacterium]|nr:MerR family transcriptional regulator [Desulfuromonadaceae bacterium]